MKNIVNKSFGKIKNFLARSIAAAAAGVMLAGTIQMPAMAEDHAYTLNIKYHCNNTQIQGAEFSIIKAASFKGTEYTLVSPFDTAKVDPNKITQDNAQESAKTLAALYKEGAAKATTDGNGNASLGLDDPGLYLVMQTGSSDSAKNYYSAGPMVVYLTNGSVTIEPKTSKKPTETTPPDDNDDDDDDDTPSTPSSSGSGAISVYKVDANNQDTYLQGAVFSLYKSDGTKVGTYTTDTNGYFGVSYLAYGNYYLVEDKAPDGYVGGTDKINFTLNATTSYNSSYPWNIKVTNTKQETPVQNQETKVTDKQTGDASNLPLMAGGIAVAVVVIGTIFFIIVKKNKENND